jgi:predicted nuclease with TOPRIM domain
MGFSPESEKLVNELIQAEYLNAVVNFGEKYNSLHEGYAVLKEEVEEVITEIKFLEKWLDNFWHSIKVNNCSYNLECVEEMLNCVENAMKELAQVGAVLKKRQNTVFGEVEE